MKNNKTFLTEEEIFEIVNAGPITTIEVADEEEIFDLLLSDECKEHLINLLKL